MDCYWQQPAAELQWNLQHFPNHHSVTLANEVSSAFPRTRPSRVTKPRSAGNSPHSLHGRRTTMAHGPSQYRMVPLATQQYPIDPAVLTSSSSSLPRRSRPTSWHPSSLQPGYPYYTPKYHPSWMTDNTGNGKQQPYSTETFDTASVYGLVTPVSHPVTGEPISNEYFSLLDNNYGFQSAAQAFTPIEPTQMMQPDFYPMSNHAMDISGAENWMPGSLSISGHLAANQIINLGQQSVTSSGDLTAPPTPDVIPVQNIRENSGGQQQLLSKLSAKGDDLIGVGLYDEPGSFSLGGGLLGATQTFEPICGKGLKLEETFTPPPPETEDADGEEDDDDDDDD